MLNRRYRSPAGQAIEIASAHMRLPRVWLAAALCCLSGCMLDSSPRFPPNGPPPVGDGLDGGARKTLTPGTGSMTQASASDGGSKPPVTPMINTARNQPPVTDDTDAGTPADKPDASGGVQVDAGVTRDPTTPGDPTAPDTTAPAMPSGDRECTRDALRSKADAYFDAMASGQMTALQLHASLRYTENGKDTALGAGLWLRRPRKDFARHVLDETNCSTLTQAVVSALTARIIVGVRLRYLDGQLLEVEAQTVPDDATLTNIDAIIPMGADRWIEPVANDARIPRDELLRLGEQYFNAASGGGAVPASAPECRRRQNGIPMAEMGSCSVAPGTMRFEQRRFAVIDEPNGILTAAVLYDNHLGFYLFKMAGGRMLNIEVVGGATVVNSGW